MGPQTVHGSLRLQLERGRLLQRGQQGETGTVRLEGLPQPRQIGPAGRNHRRLTEQPFPWGQERKSLRARVTQELGLKVIMEMLEGLLSIIKI